MDKLDKLDTGHQRLDAGRTGETGRAELQDGRSLQNGWSLQDAKPQDGRSYRTKLDAIQRNEHTKDYKDNKDAKDYKGTKVSKDSKDDKDEAGYNPA